MVLVGAMPGGHRHKHALRRVAALAHRKGFELGSVANKARYQLQDFHKGGLIELSPKGRLDFSLGEAAAFLLPLHDRPFSR